MSIVKVIEVLAESERSWEDAAQEALSQAAKSVRNIRSLYVKEMQLVLKDGKPRFRIDAKLSFELEPEERATTRLGAVAASRKQGDGA